MKLKLFYALLFTLLLSNTNLHAQNVGINNPIPDASALLDLTSTNKGLLAPRMTSAQRIAIAAPATGLLVYDTTLNTFYYYNGSTWTNIFTAVLGWGTGGNGGTTPTTNFMGTTDSVDIVLRANNIERVRIKAAGNVGVGTNNPSVKLHVLGNYRLEDGTQGLGRILMSDALGNASWKIIDTLLLGKAANGLYFNTTLHRIHMGGALTENTTIAGGNFNFTHDLTGTGDFSITEASSSIPSFFVAGNNGTATDGFVGMGTASPKQNLDINGRLAVQSGVIQRGITTINATFDLGLYQQTAGATMRLANNAGPIKFYTDQGGGNSAGTNAIMSVDNANGGAVKIHAETTGAGNAGVPSANAALDIQSTTKGVFFPRMTTAQRDVIAPGTADAGLMIYNLDQNCINWWDTRTNTSGAPGFWNSQCEPCQDFFAYAASSNGNNFFTQVGSPNRPKTYCVTINAGVTLGASVAAGNALDFSFLPAGSKVIVSNFGSIRGGGGNGGRGGSERDAACGVDVPANGGGNGGDAIITGSGVQVTVYNYGTIAGGGGGGGGGAGGCRSNGGSGGGGAGVPGGTGAVSLNLGAKVSGAVCNICVLAPPTSTSGVGALLTGGLANCTIGNAGAGCFATGSNGGCGGNGGGPGLPGLPGTGTTCGASPSATGGAAGAALTGNGSGSFIVNTGGSIFGTVTP